MTWKAESSLIKMIKLMILPHLIFSLIKPCAIAAIAKVELFSLVFFVVAAFRCQACGFGLRDEMSESDAAKALLQAWLK